MTVRRNDFASATAIAEEKPKQKRGFAVIDPELRRRIASMGGLAVPPEKRSFSVDKTLASTAGAKGGSASQSARQKHKPPHKT